MIEQNWEKELIELLVRRIEVLSSLDEEPMEKPALVDKLDTSRSTVDRAVRNLETHGLITYTAAGYTTTTLGELATRKLTDLAETLHFGIRLEPFLRCVSADSFDLDLRHLADADLYLPEPNDPYAMVNRHVSVVETAMDHRLVLPLVGLHGMQAVHEVVLEEGAESEAVVTPGVAETFQSNPDYAPLYDDLAATDRFQVFVYDGTIPYFVGIFDEIVQIGVDEDGEPRALLETEAAKVRDWAEDVFRSYKRESDVLT